MKSIKRIEEALSKQRLLLSGLPDQIKQTERALADARAKRAQAVLDAGKPTPVPRGTVVAKVWPSYIHQADEVKLRGYTRPPCEDELDARSTTYDYVRMTGNPEKDKWRRGGCNDHTSPTFIRASAAKRWNELARKMNRLLLRERVIAANRYEP